MRIVNGIDKFVRGAMPMQEEEKASEKPAAKASPTLKPSSIGGWDFTPIEQRQWIDIETQESSDPYCFEMSKFITRFLRHSQKVYREADGAFHYDQVIGECKKKQSDNTECWSDGMKKDFINAPYWSIEEWISVLAKGGGDKIRFQYCLNPNYPHQFLYLRAIQGLSGRTIKSCIARQCAVTRRFYRVYLSRRKWKRIEVNCEPWFDSRKSQFQNGQTSCILHYCESDGSSRWIG